MLGQPSRETSKIPSHFMLQKPELKVQGAMTYSV